MQAKKNPAVRFQNLATYDRTCLLINPKLIHGQFITVYYVSNVVNNFLFFKYFYPHVFHRMKECVMLEGTTVGHLAQSPCSSRIISEHTAQDCVQTVLEYLQSGRLHNFSGQSVPVCGHPHSEELPHIHLFFHITHLIKL